ncbi:homocysteine S-methyltransferase [Leptolyngbya sp. 'hensonii']|uniref:homocysteine S-methyltransferase family protein n=1 Tax=Leptolyngbya sp. 'hensonii' TaxID=1922337 RepID=UPI00094FF8E7|nr:homocysteine S-methyltransferase family protein [Leptolyngbya sp. 'hensonii']OLP19361.1 homocysteine S-methyltransferase [Leptolyngbya sp. 'hensonii']
MTRYRHQLPQLSNSLFITDGGLETTLIFHQGWDLPDFAAFDLLKHQTGYQALRQYFQSYAVLAQTYGMGLVLESATWRANPDWGTKLGYDRATLAEMNRRSIALLHQIRTEYETVRSPMVISGCLGPRGDGYIPSEAMTIGEAAVYHQDQITTFWEAGADLVTAMTMNYVEEAIGIVQAAQFTGMPVAISFTVETDGNLPTGQPLADAIAQVDAITDQGPAYYMINCAHPTHFEALLSRGEPWVGRIRGLRGNASAKSHAELNEATELDDGNPEELAQQYRDLREQLPHLTILGGCCGTDQRHIESICKACVPLVWTHFSSIGAWM